MSPKEARIYFVEDDDDSRETATEYLTRAGHRVVETASTLPEALSKIPGLGSKGVNVAVVDGNLSQDRVDGHDGEKVASSIKSSYPGIYVIGRALEKPIESADTNCTKMEGSAKLVDTVTKA